MFPNGGGGWARGLPPRLIQRTLQCEERGWMARVAAFQDSGLGMATTWSVFMTGSYRALAGSLPRASFAFTSGDCSSAV